MECWDMYMYVAEFLQSQQSDCNLLNQAAISNNRLQSPQSDCNTGGLQSDCWYCSLILEVSQNQRTSNRGFPLVEGQKSRPLIGWKDRIKKIQGISLSFRNLSHSTHSRWQSPQSDCNLYNQTVIFIIRLQSPKFDSNLHNWVAIYTIILLCRRIAVWLLRLLSHCWGCSLILEVSQNQRTWNRGFPLVERPKSRPLMGWKDRI